MPNLAFHLEVLDKVIAKLMAGGDPSGVLMNNNKQFAALGALGPDLLRYIPISTSLCDALVKLAQSNPVGRISTTTLTNAQLQELFLNPVGAIYALLFRLVVVPNWPTINQIRAFFTKLDGIVAAQNELAIPGIINEAQDVLNKSKALKNTLPQALPNVATIIGQIIGLPPWMEQTLPIPVAPADPRGNRLSEFLRWHKTGEFARNLLQASASDHQKAFALGWLCHIASSVTGEPFINNITGGPYRTHWWCNRFISNWVDAWTSGFYQSNAHMTGDNPTPPYANWQPLCSANLQDMFNVAGLSDGSGGDVPDAVKAMATGNMGTLPSQFPAEIANLFETVVNQTYPAATQPLAGFSANTFGQAFVGAFAVYAVIREVDDPGRVGECWITHPQPHQLILLDGRIAAHPRVLRDLFLSRDRDTASGRVENEAVIAALDSGFDQDAEMQPCCAMAAAVDKRRRSTRAVAK